jgi:hypothetical protein
LLARIKKKATPGGRSRHLLEDQQVHARSTRVGRTTGKDRFCAKRNLSPSHILCDQGRIPLTGNEKMRPRNKDRFVHKESPTAHSLLIAPKGRFLKSVGRTPLCVRLPCPASSRPYDGFATGCLVCSSNVRCGRLNLVEFRGQGPNSLAALTALARAQQRTELTTLL